MSRVVVVGAGPAGMTAAIEVAQAGCEVIVLDEGPRAGGQIFRQAPAGFSVRKDRAAASPNHARGHMLIDKLAELGVEVVHGVTVWNAAGGQLEYEVAGQPHRADWDRLILATGAYDRSVPFPGWTLPGVITAGAAQVMVRGYLIAPGTRAVVAGTGPLLLPTLTALHAAGVEVVAGLEACPKTRAMTVLPGIMASPSRRREAMHYANAIRRHRLPYSMGQALFEVVGDGRVQSAVIGKLDRDGRPRRDTAREVEVDLVCTGFGLSPSVELAQRIGCEMHHLPVRGGWVPRHDEQMETTVPGVYVAGEIAGIGGADVAIAEGALAGRAVATALGAAVSPRAIRSAVGLRARERRAADSLLRVFAIPDGLYDLVADETLVCRCEDVSFADLARGTELYGRDLRAAKMATRAGMGPCQGRICQAPIGDLLRCRLGGAEGPPPCPVVQLPVKPVSVATVLGVASPPCD